MAQMAENILEDNWTFIAGYLLVNVRESYEDFKRNKKC